MEVQCCQCCTRIQNLCCTTNIMYTVENRRLECINKFWVYILICSTALGVPSWRRHEGAKHLRLHLARSDRERFACLNQCTVPVGGLYVKFIVVHVVVSGTTALDASTGSGTRSSRRPQWYCRFCVWMFSLYSPSGTVALINQTHLKPRVHNHACQGSSQGVYR